MTTNPHHTSDTHAPQRCVTAIVSLVIAALLISSVSAYAYFTSQATGTGTMTAEWETGPSQPLQSIRWFQLQALGADSANQCVRVEDRTEIVMLDIEVAPCVQTPQFQWGFSFTETDVPEEVRIVNKHGFLIDRPVALASTGRPVIPGAGDSRVAADHWLMHVDYQANSVQIESRLETGQCASVVSGQIALDMAPCISPGDAGYEQQLFRFHEVPLNVNLASNGDMRILLSFGGYELGGAGNLRTNVLQRQQTDGSWVAVNTWGTYFTATEVTVPCSNNYSCVPVGISDWRIVTVVANGPTYTLLDGIRFYREGEGAPEWLPPLSQQMFAGR